MPYTNFNSKLTKNLNVPKTIKLLEENTGEKYLCLVLCKYFSAYDTNTQSIKEQTDTSKFKIFTLQKTLLRECKDKLQTGRKS